MEVPTADTQMQVTAEAPKGDAEAGGEASAQEAGICPHSHPVHHRAIGALMAPGI